MMGTIGQNIAAVIMAGGKSARFEALERDRPKCLFPIQHEQTLLTRLIDQLQAAEITDIAVCCSPENYPVIEPFMDTYRATTTLCEKSLKAISCENRKLGPLPALAEALSHVSAQWILLCLADIFFDKAPFDAAIYHLDNSASVDGCLVTGTDQTPRDGPGTGVVICDTTRVRAISYQPFAPAQTASNQHRYWTGSFLFREGLIPDLNANVINYHQAPFETWIQELLDRGAQCRWVDAGPFVNVNYSQDYRFLINRLERETKD